MRTTVILAACTILMLLLSQPLTAQVRKADPKKVATAEAALAKAEATFAAQNSRLRELYGMIESNLGASADARGQARLAGDLARVLQIHLAPLRAPDAPKGGAAVNKIREILGAPLEKALAALEQPVLRVMAPALAERVRSVASESGNATEVLALSDEELAAKALHPVVDGSRPFFQRWNLTIADSLSEVVDFKAAFAAREEAREALLFAKDPLLVFTKGAPSGFARVPFGGYDVQSTSGFSSGRRPARRINLERDVFLGLREVTQGEYFEWFKTLGRPDQMRHVPKDRQGKALWVLNESTGIEQPAPDRLNHPVVGVDLISALAYATSKGARLPTEEEWSAMAGGPDGLNYPYGKEFNAELCNGGPSGKKDTVPVGSYPEGRGPFGHYDVSGNVAEWTQSYEDGKPVDGNAVSRDLSVVVRGGSFQESAQDLSNGWVWLRQGHQDRDINTGFRLAITGSSR
jgi:formylglycine-generating enzyme required for sulfatase activity